MDYEIVELKEKNAAVISARTSNASPEMGEVIGGLWKRFYSPEIAGALKNRADEYALGIYTEYDSDEKGAYTAAVGCAVSGTDGLPEGMRAITIPAGRYAVFSITGGLDTQQQLAALRKLWQELWSMNLGRAFSCDFEEYRSADPNRADIRVYIGLK